MRRGAVAVLVAALLALGFAVVPQGAPADTPNQDVAQSDKNQSDKDQGTVNVEVRVIRASNEGSGVDPLLEDLRDRFSRFNYKSYRLIDSRILRLGPDVEGSVSLPNGDVFRLKDVTLRGGRARMTVGTSNVVLKVSLANHGTVVVGGLNEGNGESELMVAVTAQF